MIRLFTWASRCHVCHVRVRAGEKACAEHSSRILTPAEMRALYAEATREPD